MSTGKLYNPECSLMPNQSCLFRNAGVQDSEHTNIRTPSDVNPPRRAIILEGDLINSALEIT